jgi:hypothetical protein
VSHVATVDVVIKDLDCLQKAAESLGLVFNRDAKTFYSYQSGLTCDHSLSVKEKQANPNRRPYEIGVVKGEGGYSLQFDPFNHGYGLCPYIESEPAKGDAGKLVQAYALEVAKKQARMQGFLVREVRAANGAVTLTLSR